MIGPFIATLFNIKKHQWFIHYYINSGQTSEFSQKGCGEVQVNNTQVLAMLAHLFAAG